MRKIKVKSEKEYLRMIERLQIKMFNMLYEETIPELSESYNINCRSLLYNVANKCVKLMQELAKQASAKGIVVISYENIKIEGGDKVEDRDCVDVGATQDR